MAKRRKGPPSAPAPEVPQKYEPGPNAKYYYMDNAELEKLIIRHVAEHLGMKPPFVHSISKNSILGKVEIVLDPVANVYQFKKRIRR